MNDETLPALGDWLLLRRGIRFSVVFIIPQVDLQKLGA